MTSEESGRQQTLNDQKSIEYFSQSYNGWLTTRLEQDKSILTLSAGAIGLLVTLLTTVGFSTISEIILFICALFSFLISVICVLCIFRENSNYLLEIIKNNNDTNAEKILKLLDTIVLASFLLGILLTIIIGITIAFETTNMEKFKMCDRNNTEKTELPLRRDSWAGATDWNPSSQSQSSNETDSGSSTSSDTSSSSSSSSTSSNNSDSND